MPRPVLVTIAVSHFCEKARWALDRAAVGYVERAHAPLLHYAVTVPRYRQRSTPILVTPHGTLRDSGAILRHADGRVREEDRLFPREPPAAAEVARLTELFDRSLGPATRRVAYHALLRDPVAFARVCTARVPAAERVVFQALLPGILRAMTRGLRLHDADAARSRARIDAVFDEVDARLAGGGRYLVGPAFSAADLTFAALSAPVLLPSRDGVAGAPMVDLPSSVLAIVEHYRARPAGRFALRLYEEHRNEVKAPS